MESYEVESVIDSRLSGLRSDVEYYADNRANEARMDAQRYSDNALSSHSSDNHISFQDLRQGLVELTERVADLERELRERGITTDA